MSTWTVAQVDFSNFSTPAGRKAAENPTLEFKSTWNASDKSSSRLTKPSGKQSSFVKFGVPYGACTMRYMQYGIRRSSSRPENFKVSTGILNGVINSILYYMLIVVGL